MIAVSASVLQLPQNRLPDHRINLTLYKLELIMAGALDEGVEALKIAAGEGSLKRELSMVLA